ncbi:YciI family protein [uncultured Aureimonas sp.]|uniref:YciI family protein n=1 Tax=uncultured Aureimonas sp. TaxID=1604662 RepID=UPI0025F31F82|nr:YciI family protein [uncultured Aureimonas sp.]
MHFIVHCLDRPNAVQDRLAHYDAHKAYLASASVRSVISGPLVADDNETMIGSLFLLEADSKDEVLAFNAADPFNRAGIWEKVEIHPFLKRVDNR